MRRLPTLLVTAASVAACGGDTTPPERKTDPAPSARPPAAPVPPAAANVTAVPEAPTFAAHVAPLVYAECTPCHHDGGSAPFALASYDDVRDHATQIVELTATGAMPPWLPTAARGVFVGARRLDDGQRQTLARWAETGTPRGDATSEPRPPSYDSGWQLGPPDLVLDTGPAFELPADGTDVYRNFVIAVPPGPTRWVRAVEILPGDPRVVHHGVLRVDPTGTVRRADAQDPLPGFDGMVFAGARMPDGRFLGWTPGKLPTAGSDDRAFRLVGGVDFVLQLHLRPSGKVEPIEAKIGLHFASRPPRKPAVAIELMSTEIELPPGSRDVHARDSYTLPVDALINSVYPHAHYLGHHLEGWAELPDGSRRSLVEIDDWDFDWQDEYRFVTPVRLPRGSVLHMDWSYDNSADNPHNPSSPPQPVRYGAASTDEMAELILEVEPVDPAQMAILDQDYGRKWLAEQAAVVERKLVTHPDDADSHADLAAFRQLMGKSEASITSYRRAIAIDPGHVRALTELGIVLSKAGRGAEAVAQLRAATKADPDDARAHLALANALRKEGETTAAIEHYRRSIALDDSSANAHNNLGIMLEGQGDKVGAGDEFARALELQPSQTVFRKNLLRVRPGG
jgi:Tfp pilus assembly protein PilF